MQLKNATCILSFSKKLQFFAYVQVKELEHLNKKFGKTSIFRNIVTCVSLLNCHMQLNNKH